MKKTKKNNDGDEQKQKFDFCEVCRLNHNQGRRHNFFPSHKTSLSTLLTRFQSKLSDLNFFLKTPMLIRPDHAHQNRLWCVFCNCEIIELDTSFACGNAIGHLASEEHWKRVKGFMWKYGGGMDRVDSLRIAAVDYAKWEKKCKTLNTEAGKAGSVGPVRPLKNIHNELNIDSINSFNIENDVDSRNFCIPNDVVPLHSYTNERTQVSWSLLSSVPETATSSRDVSGSRQVQDAQYLNNSTGYMDNQNWSNSLAKEGSSSYGYFTNGSLVYSGVALAKGENKSTGLMNLTKISATFKEDIKGNVHSGAPPPWFDATKGNGLDVVNPEASNLVSYKPGKSSKLNPKRVGAAWAERRKLELELERRGETVNNNYDANWLPNFGRVWQSGTRKESRKEFQVENKASPKGDNHSETLMPLQPYISKRMRKDTSESTSKQ